MHHFHVDVESYGLKLQKQKTLRKVPISDFGQ